MATFQGSSSYALFLLLAKLNNINVSSLKITYASASTYSNLPAVGTVDFITTTSVGLPQAGPLAAQNGIQLGEFPYKDNGLNMYGVSIFANNQLINTQPNLVKAFVNATLYSIYLSYKHPQEAAQYFIQYEPQFKYDLTIGEWQSIFSYMKPNINTISDPLTIGWYYASRLQNTADITAQAAGIHPADVSKLYTNQFVKCC